MQDTTNSGAAETQRQLFLNETLAHFNRERIPERVTHTKGAGAHGTFRVTRAIPELTRAGLFAQAGNEVPAFARFSNYRGEQGSPDTVRDPKGIAVKLYTDEGNWDLTGNNAPVFFLRDPLKLPEFAHSQRRDPRSGLYSPAAAWDFWSKNPETLHMLLHLFGARGLPRGYRHMHGYSANTYSLENAAGQQVWVRFHLRTEQGVETLSPGTARRLAGDDPDHARRDLFVAIERGEHPRWRVCLQTMRPDQALASPFDPFDCTKVWPQASYPLREVGILELNRNPADFFAEVEQAAFAPGNVVPGIGFSPDPVLQARLFAYPDAQRYRLGVNHSSLPINRPRCPAHPPHRDGAMRSLPSAPARPVVLHDPEPGPDLRGRGDDFVQPRAFYRLLSPPAREELSAALARDMLQVPREIQLRQLVLFDQVDPDLGRAVSEGLGLAVGAEA